MSNRELATTGGNYLSTNDDYFAALASEAAGLKGGGDGKAFMKFDGNDGSASYGAEDNPLDTDARSGTEFAMNPRSYARGWVIWVNSEVVHEEMVKLEDGPQPSKSALPDKGPYGKEDGPVEQYTIDFRLMEEPHVEMVFQANNVSKRRALAALLKDFGNGFRSNPGKVPVVRLTAREFEGKTEGGRKVTKYAPEFKIVRWESEEKLAALVGDSKEAYDDDRRSAPALEDRSRDDDRRPAARDDRDDRRPAARDDREDDRRPARDDREERRPAARDDRDDDRRPARDDRDDRSSRDDDRRPARDDRDDDRRPARDDRDDDRRPARDDRDDRDSRSSRDEEERPARRAERDDRDDRPAPSEDERPARRSSRDDDAGGDAAPARGRGRF
ncbi:hypothetical protein BAJUN_03000 [Bajunvirus bajun]|uniref:Uncharacterized protein n=1 Tax=Brevundimonas phage vB_BgoS-Bajun TaxID=2948594 RepID=A0A9E7N4U2_9CAUD|nr:hypothetical protein BAJUN_03000 [Brevundimonas phage vB_BgoS-Bajun]